MGVIVELLAGGHEVPTLHRQIKSLFLASKNQVVCNQALLFLIDNGKGNFHERRQSLCNVELSA